MFKGKKKLEYACLRKVIYTLASVLMPSILLFDLFNRHHGRHQMFFLHAFIIAGLLALLGLLLFVVFKRITESIEGALLLVLLFWVTFWHYEMLLGAARGLLSGFFLPSRVFALLLLGIIGLVTIALRIKKPPLEKIGPAFNMLALSVLVIFIFNFVPGVNHEITFTRARAEVARLEESERPFYIKREFYVNPTLPHPDIYWFHMDGLMSIEKVEEFWGLDYDHFREKLHARGFLIYEGAQFNGGFSDAAMPALLSPAFYDSFWGEQLASAETMLTDERATQLFQQVLPRVGLEGREDIAPYFELFGAFFAGGYELTIHTYFEYLPTSFGHLYGEELVARGEWNRFTGSYLPAFLSEITPLPMIHHEPIRKDTYITHLVDIEPVANFTWFEYMDAHMGSMEHRVTEVTEVPNNRRYDLYPTLGFEYSFWKMMGEINRILERNPNAVIIVQSDHGIHISDAQEHLLEQGYSHEQILMLMHSVFSAVRIPDVYGGLEEPIAPLNITRELVNRFVGENYELLPGE